MIRVTQYLADMAAEVLECAKANDDMYIATICRRIRQGWLLGHRVSASDAAIVRELADALAEG